MSLTTEARTLRRVRQLGHAIFRGGETPDRLRRLREAMHEAREAGHDAIDLDWLVWLAIHYGE